MAQRNQTRNNSAGVSQKFYNAVSPLGSTSKFSPQPRTAEKLVKIDLLQQTKPVRVRDQMIQVEFNHNPKQESIHSGKPRLREPARMERAASPVVAPSESKQPSHVSSAKAKSKDGDGGGGGGDATRHKAECDAFIKMVKHRIMESVLSSEAAGGASAGTDKIIMEIVIASKKNILLE